MNKNTKRASYLKSPMGEVRKFSSSSAEEAKYKRYGWKRATREEYLTWIRARGRLIFAYFGFPRD